MRSRPAALRRPERVTRRRRSGLRARSVPAAGRTRWGGRTRSSPRGAEHGHAVEVQIRQRKRPVRSERVHDIEGTPLEGVCSLGRDASAFSFNALAVRINEFRDRDLEMPGDIGFRSPVVEVPVERTAGPRVELRGDIRCRPVEGWHSAMRARMRGHGGGRRVRDVGGSVAVPGIGFLDPLPPPFHLCPPLCPLVP
ncbi:hypothetical protein Mapa_016800 [Marchantia paleacea]|nr:hypothetical protein Mapa_016800 [Marchantia paleacea]